MGARLIWNGKDVTAEIERLRAKGLDAAALHAVRRLKEVLSVPAPRTRVKAGLRAKLPGAIYYRATTKAIKGAPPRKLSGRGRASVMRELDVTKTTARIGTNVRYMGRHEFTGHPWLVKTILLIRNELAVILGRELKIR